VRPKISRTSTIRVEEAPPSDVHACLLDICWTYIYRARTNMLILLALPSEGRNASELISLS
jgi:hypothetical protein